jgi:hypothetical protein
MKGIQKSEVFRDLLSGKLTWCRQKRRRWVGCTWVREVMNSVRWSWVCGHLDGPDNFGVLVIVCKSGVESSIFRLLRLSVGWDSHSSIQPVLHVIHSPDLRLPFVWLITVLVHRIHDVTHSVLQSPTPDLFSSTVSMTAHNRDGGQVWTTPSLDTVMSIKLNQWSHTEQSWWWSSSQQSFSWCYCADQWCYSNDCGPQEECASQTSNASPRPSRVSRGSGHGSQTFRGHSS